jgi:tetratricopeptide (TPR) repeat protein
VKDVVPLLKHSPSAQDPEILEEITVQREPLVAGLVKAALDVEGGPRHQLLIGPRGIGKTHIVSLVARRLRVERSRHPVVVAWLREDPWQIRSYEKFLGEIISRLAIDIAEPDLAGQSERIRSGGPEAELEGEQLLREVVGRARLILLVENLDEIFRKIGANGQARFRAFAEDWRQLLIIGTAPQLFEGVQLHESPFYGFFAITHLEELSLDSARELMLRIAELREDAKLAEFLRSDVATRRLAAVEALAGGHPRVWLLLSGCVSIQAIDDLVPLFLEALDELTPYYQARLRELGDQQQELIFLLSEAGGAMSNRELADRSGLPQNQVASMVRQLDDRGYIRRATVPKEVAGGDERMSYWELREPLMRLCLDVKHSRGEPLRMVVEFLRAWYGPRLLDELAALPASAELATTYVTEALRSFDEPFSSVDLFEGTPGEIVARAERGLSLLPDRLELRMAKATGLVLQGRLDEGEAECQRLIESEEPGPARIAYQLQKLFVRRMAGKPVDEEGLAAEFLELYEASPEDRAIVILTGKALADLRHYEDAVRVLPRALALDPEESQLWNAFGVSLLHLERFEEAVEAFERVIELSPDEEEAYGRRGESLRNLDRPEEALESFREAARINPGDYRAFQSIGLTLVDLGQDEEALAALGQAGELEPANARLESQRSMVLRRLGRHEEAVQALDRAIELDPEASLFHERRGILLNEMGHYEDALEAFSRARDLEPDRAAVHSNWGVVLTNLRRYEEALVAFLKAYELNPESPAIQSNLGGALAQLGRYDEAVEFLRRGVEENPEEPNVWNNLGGALSRLGQREEALDAFRKAIELSPEEPDYRENLGIVLMRLQRYEEAAAALSKAVELNPGGHRAVANLAAAQANLGRHEEARGFFEKALQLNPNSASVHDGLGLVLHNLGRPEEALDAFAKAIEFDPNEPQLHSHLANVLLEMGSLAEAGRAIQRALELDPDQAGFHFTAAEISLMREELEDFLRQLHEGLRLWSEDREGLPGDASLICMTLWARHGAGDDLGPILARLTQTYEEFGAAEDLGRGLVSTIPVIAAAGVADEAARSWLEVWQEAPASASLAIPLGMVAATVRWKEDRDRAHLMNLPQEQREILTELLADSEDGP